MTSQPEEPRPDRWHDPLSLNLGSGSLPITGMLNVDIADIPGVDVVWDLDEFPWPFLDDSAKFVRAYDIFEHINCPLEFMRECWRVLKDQCALELHVSYWKSENAYTDPTHKRFCTEKTFDYWIPGTPFYERYGAAYAGPAKFIKEECFLSGQELHVVLRKLA